MRRHAITSLVADARHRPTRRAMGLLKFALPLSGSIGLLAHLAMLLNPDSFFKAFDLTSIGKEAVDSPLVMHLVFILATTRVAVNALGVASFFYGSETRFRVGIALLFTREWPTMHHPTTVHRPRSTTLLLRPAAPPCCPALHHHHAALLAYGRGLQPVRGVRPSV